jgi:glycosyltransferase involved in cell wall biosynthesis
MRVLVVLAQPPLPQGGAAGRCAWALLQGLRSHGLDVRAIAARRPDASRETPSDRSIEVIDVPAYGSSLGERLQRLRMPRSELSGTFAEHVQAAAADADVVHLDELESSWCAVADRSPSVLHLHYLVEEDRGPGPPWTRSFFRYYEEVRAERLTAKRHPDLVANSPRVADLLRKLAPRARVTVVPLGLDPAQYRRAPLDGPPEAGLIGTLDWPPTMGAVRTLLSETWPAVHRNVRHARLVLAGRGMEQLAVQGGVEAIGPVGSSADFFDELSLLLYPIRRGSGMKVKVLEAMASGVPVVTTDIGAEGIAPNDGVVIARSEEDLVRAATRILRDEDERRERGNAGFACFRERYAPKPATEPLVGLYERLAGTPTPSTNGAQCSSSSA